MAQALHADDPGLVIMLGGGAAAAAAEELADGTGSWATVLPDGVRLAVTALSEAIGFSATEGLRR